MDGYSDSALRQICKYVNPNIITVTEFTSADGLHHGAKKLKEKLKFKASEQPIIAQIFGKNTETFIGAAKLCEDMGFTGIDINMGCPSKRVVRSEHGVALRRNCDLAFQLIETLAKNTSLPISVKTRLGWTDASDLTQFALGAQNAGADMICIHARTYAEPYNVPANFEPVYDMKQKLSIPVIGNGGITSYQDGLSKMGNLDGFLIGQAAFGNPWVFDVNGKPPSFSERIAMMKQHADYLVESKGEGGLREIRKHFSQYIKAIPNAKTYRSLLVQVHSLEAVNQILADLYQHIINTELQPTS